MVKRSLITVAMSLLSIFRRDKPIIGVVHLLPLPGSPLYRGDLEKVIDRAVSDALSLQEGGVDGVIVENLGDMPYYPDQVPPITIASMTRVVSKISEVLEIPVGVNILRNDCIASLSVAYVTRARFIRVNVLTEAVVTDQGLIEGKAHHLMRLRRYLQADIKVMADVHVKHGYPLLKRPIEESALDLATRGLADAVVVTGPSTGLPPDKERVLRVKRALKSAKVNVPVLVGSGISDANIVDFLSICDGVIVGTYFKKNGIIWNPVDPSRVRRLLDEAATLR